MKRRLLKLGLLLLLGAIVNVAVAWGCALRSFSFGGNRTKVQISEWPRPVPVDFPPIQELSNDGKFGFRQMLASAVGETRFIESEFPGGTRFHTPHWMLGIAQCGLPCLSLESTMYYSSERLVAGNAWQIGGIQPPAWVLDSNDLSKRLPYDPLWPGFAINTIFYAALLWMVFAFPFVVRRRRRIKRGLCPACAYPIGTSPVCTECGTKLPLPPQRERAGVRVQESLCDTNGTSPAVADNPNPLPSSPKGEEMERTT